MDLLENAKRADDRRTPLAALREARDGLALLMRTAGMLAGDAQISVNIDQRSQSLIQLSRLPEDFVRRLSARDPAAIDLVLAETSGAPSVTDNRTLTAE